MDPKLLELAASIAAGATNIQWLTISIVVCILVSGLYLRSRIEGYASRLGAIEAETRKIETLQQQLTDNTKIAESIKAEFAHKSWRDRERMVLMRTRLEELLAAAYHVREAIGDQMSTMMDDEMRGNDEAPRNRLSALTKLYFPALSAETNAVALASLAVLAPMHEIRQKWRIYKASLALGPNHQQHITASQDFKATDAAKRPQMNQAYKNLVTAVAALEDAAATAVKEYMP